MQLVNGVLLLAAFFGMRIAYGTLTTYHFFGECFATEVVSLLLTISSDRRNDLEERRAPSVPPNDLWLGEHSSELSERALVSDRAIIQLSALE